MAAYEPLDLSAICNVGPEHPGDGLDVSAGVHHFQGLPFLIGRADGEAAPCLLGFGEGMSRQAISVPVEKDGPPGGRGAPVARFRDSGQRTDR